jgi:D-psicose/D-tagatose/L-ribulose 3-epimerase
LEIEERDEKESRMKIGMNLLLWTAHLTEKQYPLLEQLKKTGFDGVEVPLFEGDHGHFERVGQKLKDLGLGATTVTVMTKDENPVSPDEGPRGNALEKIRRCLDYTAALGGEVLCGPLHSPLGQFTGSGPTADEKKRLIEFHQRNCEQAASLGITIGLEVLNRFETYCVSTVDDAIEITEGVNQPNFGIHLDPFHQNIEEKDVAAAITRAGKHVIHYHISENDRGVPGTGHTDWEGIFRALKKIKYDRWLTIESFGQLLPDLAAATRVWRPLFPSEEAVYREGYKFIRKMWGGVAGGKSAKKSAKRPAGAKAVKTSAKKAPKRVKAGRR